MDFPVIKVVHLQKFSVNLFLNMDDFHQVKATSFQILFNITMFPKVIKNINNKI